jgi:hypothetical protein
VLLCVTFVTVSSICGATGLAAAGAGGPGQFAGCVKRTAAGVEQSIWTVAVVGDDVFCCYVVLHFVLCCHL